MAVAHDAETRFPATDGPSGTNSVDTTTGDRTFSHAAAVGAKAAVVCVFVTGTTAPVTGVLYGGVAMTLVETATDTSEAGRIDIYVLLGVPGGTQTVTLQGCIATGKWVTASTVTAATAAVGLVGNGHVNTTTTTNPTVAVTTSAESLLYGGVHGGAASPGSYVAGSGYTAQFNNDYGALAARSQRRTSPVAAGSVTFNFTFGTSDDWCIAAVAVGELPDLTGAITRGSAQFNETAAGTTVAVNKPTDLADGDVIWAQVSAAGAVTVTKPSVDWVQSAVVQAGAVDTVGMYYLVVPTAGSEPATYTWTISASGRLSASHIAYHGVDTTTVEDVAATTNNSGSGVTSLAIPQVTTVTDGAVLISACGNDSAGTALTPPGTMGQTYQSTGAGKRLAVADEDRPTQGATGTRTWTQGSSLAMAGILAAMRPASTVTDLVVQDATQTQTVDTPTLTQVHSLVVADAGQAHTADNVVLSTGAAQLTVADAIQAQAADSLTLTQVHNLAVADARSLQTADNLTLTQVHQLVAADAAQVQAVDQLTLTQVHILAVQDAHHTHSAESPTINTATQLTVADALQAHTADGVTLTQTHVLTISDAVHAQTAESPALTQLHQLGVQDAQHAHLADTVVLVPVVPFIPAYVGVDSSTTAGTLDHTSRSSGVDHTTRAGTLDHRTLQPAGVETVTTATHIDP